MKVSWNFKMSVHYYSCFLRTFNHCFVLHRVIYWYEAPLPGLSCELWLSFLDVYITHTWIIYIVSCWLYLALLRFFNFCSWFQFRIHLIPLHSQLNATMTSYFTISKWFFLMKPAAAAPLSTVSASMLERSTYVWTFRNISIVVILYFVNTIKSYTKCLKWSTDLFHRNKISDIFSLLISYKLKILHICASVDSTSYAVSHGLWQNLHILVQQYTYM